MQEVWFSAQWKWSAMKFKALISLASAVAAVALSAFRHGAPCGVDPDQIDDFGKCN
jgi:hypothetical protein